MATFYGMNPPFIGGPQNILSRQEDEQLIKNDILQLLLTVPGERVMRPTFGTPIRSLVFENIIKNDLFTLENKIRQAISDNEPRVTVDLVNLALMPDQQRLNVKIVVRMRSDPRRVINIERFINSPTDSRGNNGN